MALSRRWNLAGEAGLLKGTGGAAASGSGSVVPTPSYVADDGEGDADGSSVGKKSSVNIFKLAHNAVKQSGYLLESSARPDSCLIVVGPRGAGKTTLLQRYLQPAANSGSSSSLAKAGSNVPTSHTPKPTEVMEYTYARKSISPTGDSVRVAHIWEVAGNKLLMDELIGATESNESFLLSMKTIATSVMMIVVDLSNPSEVIDILMAWLTFVRKKSDHVFQRLESRGSKLPSQIKAKAAAFFGKNHEDIKDITISGVSIVIVANKYDTFRNEDPEIKRVMGRVLRHAAHRFGASLVYTSSQSMESDESKIFAVAKDSRSGTGIDALNMILNHLVFVGTEKKHLLRVKNQTDHLHPLCVVAGADRLQEIGKPSSGSSGFDPFMDWENTFKRTFPSKASNGDTTANSPDLSDYAEPDIDMVKEKREEELEMLRREQRKEKQATVVNALQKRRRSTKAQ